MFIRKAASSTDPGLRSLLQKAIRRGRVSHASTASTLLWQRGDRSWLRNRIATLLFEESWPLAELLLESSGGLDPKRRVIEVLAASVKHKNAASLGSLAYEWTRGERQHSTISQILDRHQQKAVRTVSAATQRPAEFWQWARRQVSDGDFLTATETAQRKGGWPWDVAMTFAAAYLFVTEGSPKPVTAKLHNDTFDFWIAVDKHTPIGKRALREISQRVKCGYAQLSWASFYFESAVVNAMAPSPWWDAERIYRFRSLGMSVEEAEKLWAAVRDEMAQAVQPEADRLKNELCALTRATLSNVQPFQESLLEVVSDSSRRGASSGSTSAADEGG